MYTNAKLEIIQDGQPYTDSKGTKYPRNFPKDKIAELYKITEIPRPDDTATEITTDFYIDKTNTQVWKIRLKTQVELDAEKLSERQQALGAVWADAFDLLDDILNRGISAVKADRDAIKAQHPKP